MNAYLIISNNQAKIKQSLRGLIQKQEKKESVFLENNPDILLIQEEKSIGINKIRELKKNLSKKPFSLNNQYTIIYQADKLTVPAQNALLKSLEEPGQKHYLFLTTANAKKLLPTIHSRCQIIKHKLINKALSEKSKQEMQKLFNNLFQSSPGKRIKLIENYGKNRIIAQEFCQNMIIFLHQKLESLENREIDKENLRALKKLFLVKKQLESNAHVRLVLDNWALNIQTESKR